MTLFTFIAIYVLRQKVFTEAQKECNFVVSMRNVALMY